MVDLHSPHHIRPEVTPPLNSTQPKGPSMTHISAYAPKKDVDDDDDDRDYLWLYMAYALFRCNMCVCYFGLTDRFIWVSQKLIASEIATIKWTAATALQTHSAVYMCNCCCCCCSTMYIVPSLTEEKQLSLAFCTLGLPANRLYANRTEWPIFAEIYHDLYITQNRSSWVAKALYICTVL